MELTKKEITSLQRILKSNKPGVVVVNGQSVYLTPDDIKDTKTGGILPLLSLIPLIAGAIGAAGGVAGGVAKSVEAANTASHQKALQKIAREKGVRIGRGNKLQSAEVNLAIAVLENAGFSVQHI